MHRAALAAAAAGRFAVELGHRCPDIDALGERVTVGSMGGGDPVCRTKDVADAHRDRLLTLGLVQRSRELALQVHGDRRAPRSDGSAACGGRGRARVPRRPRPEYGWSASLFSPTPALIRTPTFKGTTERPLPPYCLISDRTLAVIRASAICITSESLWDPSRLCTSGGVPAARTVDSRPPQNTCLRTVPTLNFATPSAIAGATPAAGKLVPPWMTSGMSTRSWIDRRRPISIVDFRPHHDVDISDRNCQAVDFGLIHEARGLVRIREAFATVIDA